MTAPAADFPNRSHLVAPRRIDRTGVTGPTRARARGRDWVRVSHGFYVPAGVVATVEQRIAQTGVLLPEGGAVTGWAALRWRGGTWFDGRSRDNARELPVTLVSCAGAVRPQTGVAVSAERLDPRGHGVVDGLRTTDAARSLLFEMRYAEDEREATVWADLALYDDLLTLDELAGAVLAHPGWTGIPQAREALALCDSNSWSPWETRMRLVWVLDAALPPPLCNRPVFGLDGRLLGYPDLLDPEVGLVGEFEGRLHLVGEQRADDLEREALFRGHGLEYVAAVSRDVTERHRLAARLRAAYARGQRSTSPRRWTLDAPAWWQRAHTVELRRELTGRALRDLERRRNRTAS